MNDLNFFSGYIYQRKNARNKTIAVYAVIITILLAVFSSYIVTEIIAVNIQTDTTYLRKYLEDPATLGKQQELTELKQKLAILAQYNAELDATRESLGRLDVVKGALLETFNTTLPEDIVMSSLVYSKDGISIKGTSNDRIPVAEIAHNLNELGIFAEVHVADITADTEAAGSYTFTADCKLGGVMDR